MTKKADFKLDPDLEKLFNQSAELSHGDREELKAAQVALEHDAEYLADFTKEKFVEDLLKTMETLEITQNQLAERIGKTRQYLNKLLNRAHPSNLTIRTMVELSLALNRKLSICLSNEESNMCQSTLWDLEQFSNVMMPDEANYAQNPFARSTAANPYSKENAA